MYNCVNVDRSINMTTGTSSWIDAAEASGRLGVSRATLYAYVSRGYLRSQSLPGSSRERAYSRDDVERLRRRTEERRNPDKAAARALNWGMPILESSITLIDGKTLYYRGHDALDMARTRSVQEVASLIWTGRFDMDVSTHERSVPPEAGSRDDKLPFVARAQRALAAASARDPGAADIRSDNAALCGWRILRLLTATATGSVEVTPAIDRALARAWGITARAAEVMRTALILCADHELNVSSFTARTVASAGSNPYAVVIAGLAALEGPRHGGASARVESMLTSMRRARPLDGAIEARMRRGEPIDGFGHPLYPHGDPRAAMLLERLREDCSKSTELAFVLDFARATTSMTRQEPNLDFALGAVARVLRLPPGSPLTLFAIGRTIGWIGHAIEQYATGQLIRPRAKYVGVVP
jgi:citrate synthase